MTVKSIMLSGIALGASAVLLSGCLAAAVVGTTVGVASTAVGVTAKAATATVKGAGHMVGAVIPGGKKDEN